MNNSGVYIVILNFNTWQDTLECVESVYKSSYKNYEVLVVDNASDNDSVAKIEEWKAKNNKKLILIKSDKNRGFAGGNNLGLKYALERKDFEYIWLLNNDTVVAEDALYSLVEKSGQQRSAGTKIGIMGSKVLRYDNRNLIQSLGGRYNKWLATVRQVAPSMPEAALDAKKIKFDFVNGASMFVSKEFVTTVGLMDERYFLYFEELDWTLAGKRSTFKSAICLESKVYHKMGKTIGSSLAVSKRSELSDYYGIRNRIVFTGKNYPKFIVTVFLGLCLVFLKRLLMGRAGMFIRAVKDAFK